MSNAHPTNGQDFAPCHKTNRIFERGRTYSLAEIMELFQAHDLINEINHLYTLLCRYKKKKFAHLDVTSGKLGRDMAQMSRAFAGLGLRRASEEARDVHGMCETQESREMMLHMRERLFIANIVNWVAVAVLKDMTKEQFFHLSPDEHEEMRSESPLGVIVAKHFPQVTFWAQEAVRCLVLELWTACVGQSLKVVEFGVHRLAVRCGLSVHTATGSPISWHILLRDIEKKVVKFKSNGSSSQDRFAESASIAVSYLLLAKTVRNAADHPKRHFTEGEAWGVYQSARQFMDALPPVLRGAKKHLAPIVI